MRALLYCRVSSDHQREMGTIESQREALLAYARAQGWEITAVEADDGLTGAIPPWERPGMSRVMEAARRKTVDVIVVYAIDRIARDDNNVDFALVRKDLMKWGVRLATPKGVLNFDRPEDRLNQDILSALASYERHQIKDRTVRGRRAAILKGGRPLADLPLGYRWVDETRSLAVVEEEAATVREIFRLVGGEGLGVATAAKRLKRLGVQTHRRKHGENKHVTAALVRLVVQRDIYHLGTWEAHPTWLPGHRVPAEPLVSEELWQRANRVVSANYRRQETIHNQEYLLKGLARCADCGACFRIHTQHVSTARGRTPYQYYRCNNNQERINQPRCPSKLVRAEAVDEAVWAQFTRLLTQPGLLRSEIERVLAEEPARQPSAEVGLKELEAQLAALDEARARGYRALVRGLVSEDEFSTLAAELDAQRAPLRQRRDLLLLARQSEVDRTTRVRAIEAQVAEIAPRLGKLSFEERRALLHDLVESVTVDTRGRSIHMVTLLGLVEPTGEAGASGMGTTAGRPTKRARLLSAMATRATPKRRGIGKNMQSGAVAVCLGVEAPYSFEPRLRSADRPQDHQTQPPDRTPDPPAAPSAERPSRPRPPSGSLSRAR